MYNFPSIQGVLLTIDDQRIDPSCLSNGQRLIFGNLTSSPNSSLTILSGSLQFNRTYEFMIKMTNYQNPSIHFSSLLLVTIEQTNPPLIAIG